MVRELEERLLVVRAVGGMCVLLRAVCIDSDRVLVLVQHQLIIGEVRRWPRSHYYFHRVAWHG